MTWKTAVLAVVLTMVAACAALAQQSPAGGENRSAADLQQLRQELLDSLAAVRKLAPPPPAGPPRPSVDGLVFFRWNDDIKQLPGHNVFDFDRVYLTVRGSLERKVSYRLTLDAARTDRLTNYVRYCFAQVALHQAAVVRLGIQLTPMADFQENVWKYWYVQKAMAFVEGKLDPGDVGVAVEGKVGRFDYRAMVDNGQGFMKPDGDSYKDVSARLTGEIRPGVRLTGFGLLGHTDGTRLITGSAKGLTILGDSRLDHNRYDAYLTWEGPTHAVFAEALVTEDGLLVGQDSTTARFTRADGGGLSVGAFKKTHCGWGAFAKFDLVDPDRHRNDDSHLRGAAGVSYDWNPGLWVALSRQWVNYGAGAKKANTDGIYLQTRLQF